MRTVCSLHTTASTLVKITIPSDFLQNSLSTAKNGDIQTAELKMIVVVEMTNKAET